MLPPLIEFEFKDDQPLDLRTLFPKVWPLHLDIGTGKGRPLFEQPFGKHINYLGLEKRLRHVRLVASRLASKQIENSRIMRCDANLVLERLFVAGTIDSASILFPDPWHKRRHNGRRLLNSEFATLLSSRLKAGAPLYVVSDHKEYFDVMIKTLDNHEKFSRDESVRTPEGLTHFEIKYRKQRRPIYSMTYRNNS